MPCNSDYLNSTDLEKSLSRVFCILEELTTGKHVDPRSSDWGGYHDLAYGHATRQLADEKVAELCAKFKKLSKTKIGKLSLEAQIWWRDHQKADKQRERLERKKAK